MCSFGNIFKDTESEDMAAVEENWQTKRSTIRSRTAFIFNNELLSDVKFVVRASNGESESKRMKMVIPAHKFVLAISSPVFFAMFYGQMAETTDSIELPDCDYESLLEMLRYLYSDEVSLSGSNVMQVLYLANKYMVPSLAGKCTEYLRSNLKASNVFCILPHAQKFEDKDLEDRCWEVIEKQTEEAVMSDEFVTVERSLVESVVKREVLNVKEVELFKAVNRWATKECERQGKTPDGDAKRRNLGEEIVKAIRFPSMSLKEFASVVPDSSILSMKEHADMMKYYGDVFPSPLPFIKVPRMRGFQRCSRFGMASRRQATRDYDGEYNDICVTASKVCNLHGVQLFGCQGGQYKVTTVLSTRFSDNILAKQSGSYLSEENKTGIGYYAFDVLFDHPVRLESGTTYKISAEITGPSSMYGRDRKKSVEVSGVTFTFREGSSALSKSQFPGLIFSL
ncbi:BTB/POZ domain-containing protein 6-like [Oculina patagonica]